MDRALEEFLKVMEREPLSPRQIIKIMEKLPLDKAIPVIPEQRGQCWGFFVNLSEMMED
jgi:hypothetical protein